MRETPGQRAERKGQGGEGHAFVTYWLGAGCGGMMTRTSGLGGLLVVDEGPRTTAPVPYPSAGSVGLGPMYSYRTSWVRVLCQAWQAEKRQKKYVVSECITMYH